MRIGFDRFPRLLGTALKGTYLSQMTVTERYFGLAMDKLDPASALRDEDSSDLARRLARYRRRVEAEGRPRSLRLIDRAIEDAGKKANGAG